MTSTSPINQLKNLIEVRNALMQSQSIEEVVEHALEKVREELDVQVASIFLFSKDGVIERVGINGLDKNGQSIDNSWFPKEKYEPGTSFSGSTIPENGSKSGFGEPQWSNDILNDYQTDKKTKTIYLEKLGNLKSGISVPLNGRHRTFGTLEVFNKKDGQEFSFEDVYWLMLIGTSVANFISDFRKRNEQEIFGEIIKKLIDEDILDRNFNLKTIYDFVVQAITSDLTPYKVCILRIVDQNNQLVVESKSCMGGISFNERLDNVRKAGKGIVGEAYQTKKAKYVSDIYADFSMYYNQEWIENNKLKSHACIPLLVKDKVFGTISVFTQYEHIFSNNDKSFLKNIAFLTGSIVARVRIIQQLRRVRQERNQAREGFLNASLAIGYDSLLQSFLHQYKTELIGFKENLRIISNISGTKKEKKLNEQVSWIEKRIEEIRIELRVDNDVPININKVIEGIIKKLSFELSETRIIIEENYDQTIPIIEIDKAKIKDVIFNLLSNAEKAIRKANKKTGLISVKTGIITLSNIQYIQVLIKDNGLGIPNEFEEKIFNKGFTTSKKEGGTGMGLFVAKQIINDYGGEVCFKSTVGKGSSFFVTIPLKRYKI